MSASGIYVVIAVIWAVASLSYVLGIAPAIADAADELFPSVQSKEEKLRAITGPSAIVRYLPFSPELEDLMSTAFFDAVVRELKARPGEEWTVEHFSNWAILEICQKNPEAIGGKCGEVMSPEGRKPAYRSWVDWSGMRDELYALKIPMMHKDVLKTAGKRWFGNVIELFKRASDKVMNKEE